MSFYKKTTLSHGSDTSNSGKGNDLNETGDVHKNPGNGTNTYKINLRDILQQRNMEENHEGNGSSNLSRQNNEYVYGLNLLSTRRRRTVSENDMGSTLEKQNGKHSSVYSLFNSTVARFASSDVMSSSIMNLTRTEDKTNQNLDQNIKEYVQGEDISCTNRMRTTVIDSFKKLFDMKLLSKPEFQYFLFCNVFLCAGCSLATVFLAPLAVETGISNDMVALMVSIMSVIELFSRFVLGYISDKKWCHRSTLIAIACLILGVAAQFLHFMTTFGTIMIYAVIAGILQGVYFALFVVVILDILSFEDFKGALGFTSLVQGIASSTCMPILGYLRDYTGQYTYPHNFIGMTLIVGAVLIYFIPNVYEWSTKRQRKKDKEQSV